MAVDLHDEESIRSTEYGILLSRLAQLEARVLELEEIMDPGFGKNRQGVLF